MKSSIKTAIALSIIWIFGFLLLLHPASAAWVDVTPTITPIWIENAGSDSAVSGNYTVYSIEQGDSVYLGDHIDISGALAGNRGIAYFGGNTPDPTVAPVVITLPDAHTAWFDYYIDPAVFSGSTGVWYKWNGYYEPNGNTRAFKIVANYRQYTMTYPNGTVTNNTAILTPPERESANLTEPVQILPAKHIADYVVSRGSTINISVPKTSAIWLFDGSDNSIVYSRSILVRNSSDAEIVINKSVIQTSPVGDYTIIIQSVGNLSQNFDVIYDGGNIIKWFDRNSFLVRTVDFNGMTPDVAIESMEKIFPLTYDTYTKKHMEIQDPEITIARMDKVGVASSKDYYRLDDVHGNVSLMDVRGYTNAPAGTNISVILDLDHTTPNNVKYSTFHSVAQGTSFGDLRYYQLYVPLYEDSLYIGMHSMTAKNDLGASMKFDFPILVMPKDSYQENVTVKWVGDENPWRANMTIADPVVKVVTVVQTQVIVQKVTPSPEEVRDAQKKVMDEKIGYYGGIAGIGLVVIIIGYLGFRFVYRARKRKRWEGK